jgi:DNA-binding NarL/FixJ family response regulator
MHDDKSPALGPRPQNGQYFRGTLGPSRRHREGILPVNLTSREQEILELVSKGLTNPEIGNVICRSYMTVRWHVQSLCRKFDASNRTEMIANAFRMGMLK